MNPEPLESSSLNPRANPRSSPDCPWAPRSGPLFLPHSCWTSAPYVSPAPTLRISAPSSPPPPSPSRVLTSPATAFPRRLTQVARLPLRKPLSLGPLPPSMTGQGAGRAVAATPAREEEEVSGWGIPGLATDTPYSFLLPGAGWLCTPRVLPLPPLRPAAPCQHRPQGLRFTALGAPWAKAGESPLSGPLFPNLKPERGTSSALHLPEPLRGPQPHGVRLGAHSCIFSLLACWLLFP